MWAARPNLRFNDVGARVVRVVREVLLQSRVVAKRPVAGVLHVAWDESLDPASAESPAAGHRHGPPQGSGRAIVYAVSRDGGQSFAAGRKLAVRPGAFQTRPAVMPLADGSLGFAWNELSDAGKRIVWHRDDAPAAALAVRE